jgi:hypothetical protein
MKTTGIFFILALTLVTCFSSCESEDDTPPITTDLTVSVYDSQTGDFIRGASLSLRMADNPGRTINPNTSGDSGKYIFHSLETGNYNLYAVKTGYIPNETPVEVFPNKTNEVSISITQIHN